MSRIELNSFLLAQLQKSKKHAKQLVMFQQLIWPTELAPWTYGLWMALAPWPVVSLLFVVRIKGSPCAVAISIASRVSKLGSDVADVADVKISCVERSGRFGKVIWISSNFIKFSECCLGTPSQAADPVRMFHDTSKTSSANVPLRHPADNVTKIDSCTVYKPKDWIEMLWSGCPTKYQ